MKNRRLSTLLWIFCLIACSPAQATQPAPTFPVPTGSNTAAPTKASTPTGTNDPATSTPTANLEATQFAVTSSAIAAAIMTEQAPRLFDSYPSPDEDWRAEVVIYDCISVDPASVDENAYEELRVINVGSGESNVIDTQLQYCGGLGAAGLEGLFWSPNSRYFYYTDGREGVPDGCGGYWQRPILRYEISTSGTEELGGGPLSPDGTKLATWQGKDLVIWDVNEGEELGRVSYDIANLELESGPGAIVWSPDNQALVYMLVESYCPLSGQSAIVHVDLSTLEQSVVLESETPTFGDAVWTEAEEITLFDESGNQWVYTFETRELEPLP
ncbi:MAG: hypothetical protein M3Y68_02420 [Chloroflexota bacterium]|nr:hypothetical protein [Chloroflexota bacterium]